MLHQRTIENNINCNGILLHSGLIADMELLPAEINSGIKFIRTDSGNEVIEVSYKNTSSNGFSTSVINENGIKVDTIEHLMSALWFLNITNITIKINKPEIPIMDGSAEYFIFLIESAGIVLQESPISYLDIRKEIIYQEEDKMIKVSPAKGLIIDFHFKAQGNHKLLQDSNFLFDSRKHNFKSEISKARTFSPVEQVNFLKSKNLILGGNLLNALVIDDDKVLNNEKLRYNNEPVRHKILDIIGDLYLSGYHINGYFECYKSGHQINIKLLHKIFSDPDNYKISIQD